MNLFPDYETENIHYWTRRADGYSRVNREELSTAQKSVWKTQLSRRLAAHFPDRPLSDLRVLDIGTGPGFFAILLAELGCKVTAVDYTAQMLAEAERNAGPLAGEIRFCRMNAEALDFTDGSFDAAVTRNLTWNLHNPERAYAEWVRVLAPGGVLLNFDANWYRYLWDSAAQQGHSADRARLSASDVRDETAGTDVAAMEHIARQTPLSRQQRPDWDLQILQGLGVQAAADRRVWQQVWTREERINNASTPMFLVEGHKA